MLGGNSCCDPALLFGNGMDGYDGAGCIVDLFGCGCDATGCIGGICWYDGEEYDGCCWGCGCCCCGAAHEGGATSNAPKPARAISSSRPGALPPLTPIPPTVAPFSLMGQPPAAMINFPSYIAAMLDANPGIPEPHWATASVDWLNITDVVALAILILPVAQPYGAIIRSKRTRCPPASTIAMLTGLRNSLARCLLASIILRATSIDMLTRFTLLNYTPQVIRAHFFTGTLGIVSIVLHLVHIRNMGSLFVPCRGPLQRTLGTSAAMCQSCYCHNAPMQSSYIAYISHTETRQLWRRDIASARRGGCAEADPIGVKLRKDELCNERAFQADVCHVSGTRERTIVCVTAADSIAQKDGTRPAWEAISKCIAASLFC